MEFEPKTAMTTPMPVWHRNSKKPNRKSNRNSKKKSNKNSNKNQKNQKSDLAQNQKSKIKSKKSSFFFDCNQNPMLRVDQIGS